MLLEDRKPAEFFSAEGRGRLSLPLPQHNGFPFQKKKNQKEPQLFQPAFLRLPSRHKQSHVTAAKLQGQPRMCSRVSSSSPRICPVQTSSDPKFPSLPCSSRTSLRLEPLPAWHDPGSNCCFHAPFEAFQLWMEQLPRHGPLAGEDTDFCCVPGWFLLPWVASRQRARRISALFSH